jgi:hypothetical protein
VDERIRRGLVERYHSAQEQRRIRDLRAKGKARQDDIKAWAKASGWVVHTGKRTEDINISGDPSSHYRDRGESTPGW